MIPIRQTPITSAAQDLEIIRQVLPGITVAEVGDRGHREREVPRVDRVAARLRVRQGARVAGADRRLRKGDDLVVELREQLHPPHVAVLVKLLADAGAGMDLVSGGELFRAGLAGVEQRGQRGGLPSALGASSCLRASGSRAARRAASSI